MLQYDLTGTAFFEADAQHRLPTDAEMFAITAALFLIRDASLSDLARRALEFTDTDVEEVAQCVEYRLPVFTRDIGCGYALRRRLEVFIGLRIAGAPSCTAHATAYPK